MLNCIYQTDIETGSNFDIMRTPAQSSKRGLCKGLEEGSKIFYSNNSSYWEKRSNKKHHKENNYKSWKECDNLKENRYKDDNSNSFSLENIETQHVMTPVILAREKEPSGKMESSVAPME